MSIETSGMFSFLVVTRAVSSQRCHQAHSVNYTWFCWHQSAFVTPITLSEDKAQLPSWFLGVMSQKKFKSQGNSKDTKALWQPLVSFDQLVAKSLEVAGKWWNCADYQKAMHIETPKNHLLSQPSQRELMPHLIAKLCFWGKMVDRWCELPLGLQSMIGDWLHSCHWEV